MQISRITLVAVLAVQMAAPLCAQTAPDAKPDLQSLFNAATDAWVANDCVKALPIFAQLADNPQIKPGSLPYAAIAVRRGDCLIATGETAQGEVLVQQGLPQLTKAGDDFANEVVRVEQRLGNLAAARWDHDTALGHYRAALALLKGEDRSQTLMWLAQLTSFDGDNQALDAVEEGYGLASAGAKPDKHAQAMWQMMKGRILLNRGRAKDGRAALELALKLTETRHDRLSVEETLLRADLAQAAMLTRDRESAYRYMAESGAGRLAKSPFAKAAQMEPPMCGPDTGLEPEDRAVVEFSIDDSGQVDSARTVYANGSYAKAAAFARAVRQWAWPREEAALIPDFFRAATRVEIVCTRAEGMGGVSPRNPLMARFAQWAQAVESNLGSWPQWLAGAEAAQKAGKADTELAARVGLALVDLRGAQDRDASIERGLVLARGGFPGIPAEAGRAAMVLLESSRPNKSLRGMDDEQAAVDRMLKLAEDPALAQDALAQDTALLLGAPRRPRVGQGGRGHAALLRVAEDQRLAEHHPLRQFAQLRLANEAARSGDLDKAAQWFSATGLTQEQCAMIGPRPAVTNTNSWPSRFPQDALRYGFEGWARTEFDILADGNTAQVRTVIAYPPFIFTEAAREMFTGVRYQSSYRPERGAACSASSDAVRFVIPGNTNTVKLIKPKS
ncbi:tetratricopeptide (TPR) repeat protein [Novosphingobium sp. SG751A]|uniref:hypothetical protein n=1 Tax=Novosphingobium sp. SG751A TaxID=2587000 RepID=UPI0015523630|nr:hypothetical protein [Novosphingobium sp. SG751A]NOW44691.1 tetratricopeptide (TPR) repeat protein [Novosphingobium sp. SG751A]